MANIAFTFEGVDGTITDTYVMSDEDAARMLEAYAQQFTPPQRPGPPGGPGGPGGQNPPEPLTTDDIVHRIASGFWNELATTTENYERQMAASEAMATVPPVTPTEVRQGGAAAKRK
jgi:hypothetical protein